MFSGFSDTAVVRVVHCKPSGYGLKSNSHFPH